MNEPNEIDAPFFGGQTSFARTSFRSISRRSKENIFEGRPSIGSINFLFTPKERLSSHTSSEKLGSFEFSQRNSFMSNSLRKLSTIELNKPAQAGAALKKKSTKMDAFLGKTPDQVIMERTAPLKPGSAPRVQRKIPHRRKRVAAGHCQCKLSKCLKLYCECFSSQKSCSDSCQCTGCYNNSDLTELRELVYKDTLEKNPLAFKDKYKVIEGEAEKLHVRGCNCTKTQCQKNYCECFHAGIGCSQLCRCENCRNSRITLSEDVVKASYEKVMRKRRKKKTVSDEVLKKYSALVKK